MSTNYVKLIEELNNPHVHMSDITKVNNLICSIVAGGKNNLQMIFDFDRTMTKLNEQTNTHVSSFELLRHCPSISPKYLKAEQEYIDNYCPIEYNRAISDEEKKALLEKLWMDFAESLKGEPVSYEEILETATKVEPTLRDGTEKLLADLNKTNIPVLVVSGGYGDSIEAIFKHFGVLYPNVNIISNFFCFDNGVIQGLKNSFIINSRNKNDLWSMQPDYLNLIMDRSNIVVVGDSIGDAGVADGIPNVKNILKIGFKCKRTNETLSDFLKVFDVVIEDSHTLNVIQGIVKHIFE
ncbi:hypothetical protein RN001_003606 [Aquatica leii]|uniref:5'-nucleotidase n=1 Tax=Aquatica leii TaxID=1421715 RepID=A0AAN7PFB2_9COLE|nr:hypothetical protein RN001_003606 [Aquatica leii]